MNRFILAIATVVLDHPNDFEHRVWLSAGYGEDGYLSIFGDVSLRIRKIERRSGAPDYELAVLRDGEVVELITDVDLRSYLNRKDSYTKLERLYEAARSNGVGLDEATKHIFEEMNYNLEDTLMRVDEGLDAAAQEIPF